MASGTLFFLTTVSIHIMLIVAVASEQHIDDILPVLTSHELAGRVWNAEEKWPICVLYTNPRVTSNLEESFHTFLKNVRGDIPYKEWTFGRINSFKEPVDVNLLPGVPSPVLVCYVGTSTSPLIFQPTRHLRKSLRRWLKTVNKLFTNRLPPLVWNVGEDLQFHHSGYVVIGVPSILYHGLLEDILSQVVKNKDDVAIPVKSHVALPFSKEERDICNKFGITEFPAVVLLHQYEWQANSELVKVVQGVDVTSLHDLRLSLMIHSGRSTILTTDSFANAVLQTLAPQPPMVVTFYSPRSQLTLSYLHAFHRAQKTFSSVGINVRFGLLDIKDHPQAVSRYVNSTDIRQVPFTVLFWQSKIPGQHKLEVRQKLLGKAVPTPLTLYMFIQATLDTHTPSLFTSGSAEDTGYNPLGEHEHNKLICDINHVLKNRCPANESVVQEPSVAEKQFYGPQLPSSSWSYKVRRRKSAASTRKSAIPYVTDDTWTSTIERSRSPSNQFPINTMAEGTNIFSVAMVVFIQKDCGYCEIVLPQLEHVFKLTKYVGASMYLMNCTSDPITCRRHDVTGFPTIIAFRSFSWSVARGCSSSRTQSAYIRLDYHGPIMRNLILGWLSNVTQPTVSKRYLTSHRLPDVMEEDVRLVATVYTRSLAIRYLPAILHERWYPYTCLSHACEQLYGHVSCYALYSRAVVDDGSKANYKDKDQELFVSTVELQRIDGVKAKLFEVGTSMEWSMNDEGDTRLHQIHDTHRYNLPRDFRCEDDHAMCTDTIVKFVQDHRRLPIMHLTTAALHTRRSQFDRETGSDMFKGELPVLLALVRNENMTTESPFRKELTQAAYAMYREMVFVTLDVEEFAFWASNFVPKDYHRKYAYDLHGSVLPSLYYYPRLCIVQWHDHQHAAFYPPLQEIEPLTRGNRIQNRLNSINSQQIIAFIRNFLHDPQAMLVRTEMF